MVQSLSQTVLPDRTKIGGKCQDSKIQMRHLELFSNILIFFEGEIEGKTVSLESMILASHGNSEFSCKACGYTSTRKFSVKQHLKLKHTANDNVQCVKCHKIFRKELYYHRHLLRRTCTGL